MTLKGGKLVVCSMNTDTTLYFYSTPDLEYVAADGTLGEGPNEFISEPSFCENMQDQLIVNKYGNMLNLSILSLSDSGKISASKYFRLNRINPMNNMFMKNDSILTYIDAFPLSIKKYDLIKKIYTDEIKISTDNKPVDSFHPDKGDVLYNDSTIVYAYKYRNRIDIFDFESMKLKKSIKGPGEEYITNSFDNIKNSIYYYLGGYAGERFFYLFYKGGTLNDEDIKLRVFNYDGEPVCEYSFDIFPGHPFVVDENNSYLYAYDHKNEGHFLRYKL